MHPTGTRAHLYVTARRYVELGDPNFRKLSGQTLTDAANKKLRDDHGQFFIETAQSVVADLRQQCRQRFIDRTMEKVTETREYLDDIAPSMRQGKGRVMRHRSLKKRFPLSSSAKNSAAEQWLVAPCKTLCRSSTTGDLCIGKCICTATALQRATT